MRAPGRRPCRTLSSRARTASGAGSTLLFAEPIWGPRQRSSAGREGGGLQGRGLSGSRRGLMRAARELSPSEPPSARSLRGCVQRLPDAAVACDRHHPCPPWNRSWHLALLRASRPVWERCCLSVAWRYCGRTVVTMPRVLTSPALGGRLHVKVLLAVVGNEPSGALAGRGAFLSHGEAGSSFPEVCLTRTSQRIRSLPRGPASAGSAALTSARWQAGARAVGPAPRPEGREAEDLPAAFRGVRPLFVPRLCLAMG